MQKQYDTSIKWAALIFLFMPFYLRAQSGEPDPISKRVFLPYVFVEPEGFMIFGYSSVGYYGGAIGTQLHPALGFGLHYSYVAASSAYLEYNGAGISYRGSYGLFIVRADLGLLIDYRHYDDFCITEYEVGFGHPYLNLSLNLRVFKVIRLGAFISYVPRTIDAVETCQHFNAPTTVVHGRLGNFTLLPSIGATIRIGVEK